MGLFDVYFGKIARKYLANATTGGFGTFNAYEPVFTSWSGGIYESMLIRAAIEAGARHASKLRVEFRGSARPQLRKAMKIGPNAYQTWPKFLARLWTLRAVTNTAFIVPELDKYGEICGYYPVLASNVTMVEQDGKPYLQYWFGNGKKAAMEFDKCAVLPVHQYSDDFFGEDNMNSLKPTLNLLSIQNQSIQEAMKSSVTIRFMAGLDNFAKAKDLAKTSKQYTDEVINGTGRGAFMLYPNTWKDVKQVNLTPYTPDSAQMKLINENVYNYFGVNGKILQNSAVGDDLDAFFEGQLEPFAIILSDELTRMTYTPREIAEGNRVIVTANRLQYMSTANKINLAKEMGDRGVLTEDEIRELFNYAPLGEENGGNDRPIRGEYYFANIGKVTDEESDSE